MSVLVADTSGLVSLGTAADRESNPLALCLGTYDVAVPTTVVDELRAVASYDDHGAAATSVLDRSSAFRTESVPLDTEFPLDDGENAAVTLANDLDASLFLCDEFDRLGLIHASLIDTRLVTTPTLLSVFVRSGRLPADGALACLHVIGEARTWGESSYVRRARALLEHE